MKYNKSEICKRANELTKNGMSKSAAFTKAWAEAKTAEAATIAAKARAFKELQRQIEELEAQAKAMREAIIAEMNGAEEVTADVFKIRYIQVTSNRLDTTKLKKENSEVYNAYLKESSAMRFTVTA